MNAMRHNITKIARIVGISAEAIRQYEKKGVVFPRRNADNQYRSFHTLDIGTLIRCRTYEQLGFPLDDVATLIHESSVDIVAKRLLNQEAELERDISMKQRSLARLKDLNTQINNCQSEINTYRIEPHPGIFQLDYRHNEEVLDDEEHMCMYPDWASWVPLSFVSLRFPIDALLSNKTDYYAGFGVLSEDAHFLGIVVNRNIKYQPPCLSVRTVLKIEGERQITPLDFKPALEFVHSNSLILSGDPFTRMIVTVERSKDSFVRYYELWLPVES